MGKDTQKKCFVIMPFGDKTDLTTGETIPFDDVYEDIIKDVVEKQLGLDCIRCDEISKAGWIHSDMLGHILRADLAIVDISTLNPNVFYELGVRHALRPSITILIRKKGTKSPFNIEGLRVINYDFDYKTFNKAKEEIKSFIQNSLKTPSSDSLVYEVFPNLVLSEGGEQAKQTPAVLQKSETFEYQLKGKPQKKIILITGDIRDVKVADIWVNSENTNMQMSRYYERSISGIIRYLGSRKNKVGNVIEDLIADELAQCVGDARTVEPTTVLVTGSGGLEKSHKVKKIFHVAAVQGEIGQGYSPIKNIGLCVTQALSTADSEEYKDLELKSILFPLLGTGSAKGDLKEIAKRLLNTAISYMASTEDSAIERVYFLVWTDIELETCQAILKASDKLIISHKN